MIDEFSTRVLLENNIGFMVRAMNKQDCDGIIKYQGAVDALQKVLEYDDFIIDCITRDIKEQEEKRGSEE